jgi:hypothetical protein
MGAVLTAADLMVPVLPGGPKEWDAPDDLIERSIETHPRTPLLLTTEAIEARQIIASHRWYLVKNEPLNEPARSSETGRKETYFTCLGIDRPWNGVDELSVWMLSEMDPENTQPSMSEVVTALIGQWFDMGRMVEISEAKARELSLRIKLKSNGRFDIYGNAQRRLAERIAHDRKRREELLTP